MSDTGSPQVFLTIDTGTHSSTIHRLLVTPDGKSIITASMDKTIRVWDVESKKGTRKLLGEIGPDDNGSIGRIALDPQGQYLYVTARWPDVNEPVHQPVTFLRVYSLRSGNLESVYRYPGNVADMDLSADGKYLVLCSDQPRQISLFDPQDILHARTAEPVPLATIDIDPLDQPRCLRVFQQADQTHVVCGSTRKRTTRSDKDPDDDTPGSGMLYWYTLGAQGLQLDKSLQLIGPNAPLHMAVSNEYLVTNGERETGLMCYNLRGQFVQRITPKSSRDSLPASMTFSADGKRLAVGALDGRDPVRVRIYDVTDGFSLLSEYTGHDAGAQVAGFLNDGTLVSAGGTHYEIHFWDASKPQGEQQAVISGAGQMIYGVGLKDASQIGIGNTPRESDEQDTPDEPVPLSRVFDLHSFSVEALDSKEASAFQRAILRRDRQRLRRVDDNLWLVRGLKRKLLTEAPDPDQPGETLWYDASTFGFTEHGTIITGDVDGDVRVGLRNEKGEYKNLPWRIMPGHSAAVQDHAALGDWLVTAGMDQTIALWHLADVERETMESLEPALRLFVSSDNEWVIWSASGYYAASLKGDRYVGYHVNQGEHQEALFYPSDRFIKQLYRPDIIRAILVDGSEERALTRLGVTRPDIGMILPPVIELKNVTQSDGALTLDVEVRPGAQKSPLKRVWALCNDRFVWEDRSDEVANGATLTPVIPLQPGANHIKILVESEYAKSNPLILTVDGGATSSPLPASEATPKAEHLQLAFDLTPPPGPDARVQVRHAGGEGWENITPPEAANGQFRIPLAEGDNDIALMANGTADKQLLASIHVNTNPASAGVQLNDLTLSLVGGAAKGDLAPDIGAGKPPPNGTLYLLAVGVAKLQTPSGPFQNLRYADADAQAIYDQFTAQKQKAFQNVVARVLLNEQATRANIYSELDALKATIDADMQARQAGNQATRDVFLVYMSGHGLIRNGEFYFWNYDYDDTNPPETGIKFLELGDRITNVPAELIVMTDACQSGQGGTDLQNAEAAELAKRLIAISERAQVVLNGTTKDTQSIEHESIQHGLFTYCILDGLKKLSQSPNGVLILELGGYVQEWVPYYTQRFAQPQVPTLRTYGELLPLCVYRA